MRCPECNNEVNGNLDRCPHCGAPLHNHKKDGNEPRLSHGMKMFLIIGTIVMAALIFIFNFANVHLPWYSQDHYDPDSTLLEKEKEPVDTVKRDTVSRDSTEKEEAKEAEKVFNSIRGTHHRNSVSNDESSDERSESETSEPTEEESSAKEKPEMESQPEPIKPSAPKVENLETE